MDERVTAWITEHIRHKGSALRTRWSETKRRRLFVRHLRRTNDASWDVYPAAGHVRPSGQVFRRATCGWGNGKAAAVVNGLPESGSSARRRHPRLYGTLVGVGVFALVAVPAFWSGFLALYAFSGEPYPLAGAVWALVALALLALPVIAGVTVARAISASGTSVKAKILALLVCMVVLWFIYRGGLGIFNGFSL